MVTGSGGPTASQDSWKGALGGTARSFGSTVKNGTPREKKGVLAQPPLSFRPLKSQVHFHLNYSVRPAPQDPREGVSRKQARGVGRGQRGLCFHLLLFWLPQPPQSLPRPALTALLRTLERLGWGGGGRSTQGGGVGGSFSRVLLAGPGSCSGPFVTFLVTLFSRAEQL